VASDTDPPRWRRRIRRDVHRAALVPFADDIVDILRPWLRERIETEIIEGEQVSWNRRDRGELESRLQEKYQDQYLQVVDLKLHAVSAAGRDSTGLR
jgi:hypothetical protein